MAVTTAFGWRVMSGRGRAYKVLTLSSALASGALGVLYLT
jgi:hypothetical protein